MAGSLSQKHVFFVAGSNTIRATKTTTFASLAAARTALWAMRAAAGYKRFAVAHLGEDPESEVGWAWISESDFSLCLCLCLLPAELDGGARPVTERTRGVQPPAGRQNISWFAFC